MNLKRTSVGRPKSPWSPVTRSSVLWSCTCLRFGQRLGLRRHRQNTVGGVFASVQENRNPAAIGRRNGYKILSMGKINYTTPTSTAIAGQQMHTCGANPILGRRRVTVCSAPPPPPPRLLPLLEATGASSVVNTSPPSRSRTPVRHLSNTDLPELFSPKTA